jgi:hypothetical protein
MATKKQLGKLGTGSRPRTIQGHATAIGHFEKMIAFAVEQGLGVGPNLIVDKPLFTQWTKQDFANELIFGEFAYYLARNAVKDIKEKRDSGAAIPENLDGEAIAVSSAMQYMSNFVQAVLQLPGDVLFFQEFRRLAKGDSPSWMKRIRDDLRNTMERDLMLAGIPTVLKAKGIGRVVLEQIVDSLIDGCEGNHDKLTSSSSELKVHGCNCCSVV